MFLQLELLFLGSINKKFHHAYQILAFKGGFRDGNYFSDNFKWSSKNLWKISNVRANIKQQGTKELVAIYLQNLK